MVGKGENAGSKFLLFPQYFLSFAKQFSDFQPHLFCCLQVPSIWTSLKICLSVQSQKLTIFSFYIYFFELLLHTELQIRRGMIGFLTHYFSSKTYVVVTH